MRFYVRLFYLIKPLIPRQLQIFLRRRRAKRLLEQYRRRWPIETSRGRFSGVSKWPDGKQFCVVLVHDVETMHGYRKCDLLAGLDAAHGFRSSFNFVPERYKVDARYVEDLHSRGFEIGVHGLKHDGKLFLNEKAFAKRAEKINHYIREWKSVGFYSPSMHRNLDWLHRLEVEYDQSTFDTDPFEPQPGGVQIIFPFMVRNAPTEHGYVELPYTLPQDHTLFIIMKERTNDIWKRKLDWIAENGGLALIKTHPDYMDFENQFTFSTKHYPAALYDDLLDYISANFKGRFWHALPMEVAHYWRSIDESDR